MTDALPKIQPNMAPPYTVYATREYFVQLTKDVATAQPGSKIALATMSFQPDLHLINTLMDELVKAAKRDCDVSLQLDSYEFLIDNKHTPGPFLWHLELPNSQKLSKTFRKKLEYIEKLKQAGVRVAITNPPSRRFSSPFAGRSHIKYSIVGDKIYLGGCNLSDLHLDCMVSWQDKPTAEWLLQLFSKRLGQPQTIEAFGKQDIRHKINSSINSPAEIIIDVGVRNQSAIYDEALEIIDRAQEWLVITCQFFPHSTTASHLKQAFERGVKIYPIFNHYRAHSGLHTLLQWSVTKQERQRMPASFFDFELQRTTRYLHAKILASEQECLIGSHNYVPAGVKFGTAEIALHNQGKELSKASVRLIASELGLAQNPSLQGLFN